MKTIPVKVTLEVPADTFPLLTKSVLEKKETKILKVDWTPSREVLDKCLQLDIKEK